MNVCNVAIALPMFVAVDKPVLQQQDWRLLVSPHAGDGGFGSWHQFPVFGFCHNDMLSRLILLNIRFSCRSTAFYAHRHRNKMCT